LVNLTVTQPRRVEALLSQMERGELKVITEVNPELSKRLARIEAQSRRTTRAILSGSLVIAATLLYTHGDTLLALIAYGLAAVWFLLLVFAGGD
jgi:hypothetical protein